MKSVLKIFGAVALGVVMLGVVFALYNFFANTREVGNDNRPMTVFDEQRKVPQEESADSCAILPVFMHPFTDLSLIDHVAPIGAINAGSSGRSYVAVKRGVDGSYPLVPVYAPVDSTIVGITYARRGGPGTEGEYRLDIDAGCGIQYFFDHLDDVSDRIKELAPKTPADNTRTGVYVSLSITAGELLAHTDGTPQAHAWDFSVMNMNKKNSFINSDRWQWDQNTHAVCPYDFFNADLKKQYYAALALWDGAKQSVPNCGQASHDVVDTLAGGWFQKDATDMKGTRMLVGNLESFTELFIDRDNQPRFGIRDYVSKIKPEKIGIGKSACYSDGNKFAFLKLISRNSLESLTGTGDCPSVFPSVGTEKWER